MSLQARPVYVVPESTAQVARSIFHNASPVMRMLDDLHMIVEDRNGWASWGWAVSGRS